MRLLFLLLAWLIAGAAAAQTPRYVRAELIAGPVAVRPGETVWIALRQRIEPGWHTYWRNPGDAGQATQIAWTLPAGWRAGEIRWPPPTLVMVGPLANYAYKDEVLLPIPLSVPADARPGETARLSAVASWLVCEEVCVPEQARLTLAVPVEAGPPRAAPPAGEIAATLASAPRPAAGVLAEGPGGRLRLAVTGVEPALASLRAARFFPAQSGVIDHAAAQPLERGPNGFALTLTPVAGRAGPTNIEGVITLGDAPALAIAARTGPLPTSAVGFGPVAREPAGGGPGLGLLAALGLAFAGGLLLNLMPCVFPVLALKAAGLARHAQAPAHARRGALAYAAGVLATFAALALLLIALRGAGQAVGWGFQLQSPAVVAALALLMLLAALNLSGVFTVGASAQAAGGAVQPRSGLLGDALTGVLAVALAAPCVAPFMAGATGWALTQGPAEALAVFLALGLGMAAPFVALAFAPGLLARLPKPGAWMARLQRWLAVPLYLAAVWLAWLAYRQTGPLGLVVVLIAALVVTLAALAWGRHQRAGGRRSAVFAAVALLTAVAITAPALRSLEVATARGAAFAPSASGSLPAQPWTPARVAELQAQGRPVFVNFTADWCVTCKLNERLTLSDPRVAQALTRSNTAYLVADWTLRDAAIARALEQQGRAGVPLYLVYRPDGEVRVLPQILTREAVIEALS